MKIALTIPPEFLKSLGFDAIDIIVLGVAALLLVVLLPQRRILSITQALASRTVLCMTLLAALPIVLRLALLANHPVPTPRVADDFSYLLLGDTLAHFRLANSMHPMRRFFEAVFVLHDPSYSSIYPLGQGLALAFGQLVFRQPWAGVLLSAGALCALCYWMLRAWTTPSWALLGGLLAVIEFGPFSRWMNSYWGGAVSGIAGCLVFGALPRLKNAPRTRDAVILGAGLALQLLTRPFEFVLLVAIVILYFAPARSLAVAALVLLPAFGLTGLQNKQVTGSWTTLPYELSRYQYGVPAAFTLQPNANPHRPLTVEQQIDFDMQTEVHAAPVSLLDRLRYCRFFFLFPLYVALPAFLWTLREYRFIWVVTAIAIFLAGDAFYPFFYPHYIAAATCLFVLVSVKSLEILSRWRQEAATLILILCLAHFIFTGLNLEAGDPEGRIAINSRLAAAEGKQLVFVRYWPQHGAHEWIHNAADIDHSRVVWAIDLGPDEDETLRRYYPDRKAWLLEPDAHPPRLVPVP